MIDSEVRLIFEIILGLITLGNTAYTMATRNTLNKELSRCEEKNFILDTLFETAQDAMFIISKQGVIQKMNKEAEFITKWSRSKLQGSLIEEIIPERYKDRHTLYRKDYVKHPRVRSMAMGAGLNTVILQNDGNEIPVDVFLNPDITPRGQLLIIATARRKEVDDEVHTPLQS